MPPLPLPLPERTNANRNRSCTLVAFSEFVVLCLCADRRAGSERRDPCGGGGDHDHGRAGHVAGPAPPSQPGLLAADGKRGRGGGSPLQRAQLRHVPLQGHQRQPRAGHRRHYHRRGCPGTAARRSQHPRHHFRGHTVLLRALDRRRTAPHHRLVVVLPNDRPWSTYIITTRPRARHNKWPSYAHPRSPKFARRDVDADVDVRTGTATRSSATAIDKSVDAGPTTTMATSHLLRSRSSTFLHRPTTHQLPKQNNLPHGRRFLAFADFFRRSIFHATHFFFHDYQICCSFTLPR